MEAPGQLPSLPLPLKYGPDHASTPPLSFLQTGCPSCHPTNSVIALKAICIRLHQQKMPAATWGCRRVRRGSTPCGLRMDTPAAAIVTITNILISATIHTNAAGARYAAVTAIVITYVSASSTVTCLSFSRSSLFPAMHSVMSLPSIFRNSFTQTFTCKITATLLDAVLE